MNRKVPQMNSLGKVFKRRLRELGRMLGKAKTELREMKEELVSTL